MNKLLYFFKPYFDYIDEGHLFKKPFYWLYLIFAVLNLLTPIIILIGAISNRIFDLPGKYTFAFLFVWLFVVAANVLGFQLWWRRKDQVLKVSEGGSDFVATPVFAHLIQSAGEFFGSYITIAFFGVGLVSSIILGGDTGGLSRFVPVPDFGNFGFILVFVGPILGFFTIIASRYVAELVGALAAIANNTAKTGDALSKADDQLAD